VASWVGYANLSKPATTSVAEKWLGPLVIQEAGAKSTI
jgi:hypothetical protein